MMLIERNKYLNRMIDHKHNNRIKIITGIRRCGKSYLLNELFKNHLIEEGVKENHIIQLALDDIKYKKLRVADECYNYIVEKIDENSDKIYYVLIDEVQMLEDFVDVLNGLLHLKNVDVYVTGSNSKFLSKDVATEFRGRGDEIRMFPLSFSEYYKAYIDIEKKKLDNKNGEMGIADYARLTPDSVWADYCTYGGLPYILELDTDEDKMMYLKNLCVETYIRDIVERNKVKNVAELDSLVDIIASGIGTLTNAQKIVNTYASNENVKISVPTIKKYIEYLQDAFFISEAKRYDIKGRKYIGAPVKYYFEDIGLRNARVNFRQHEETHIMENIIYNELRYRGYAVDVGQVNIREREKDKLRKKQLEIDFVVNKGDKKCYIQSAYSIPDEDKMKQETKSLINTGDSFKKIIITKDYVNKKVFENGIVMIGLMDFLIEEDSLFF